MKKKKIKVKVGQTWINKDKDEVTIKKVVPSTKDFTGYVNVKIKGQSGIYEEWSDLTLNSYPLRWGPGWKLKAPASEACPHDCCNKKKRK